MRHEVLKKFISQQIAKWAWGFEKVTLRLAPHTLHLTAHGSTSVNTFHIAAAAFRA